MVLFSYGQQVQIKIHNDRIAANKSKLNAVSGLIDALRLVSTSILCLVYIRNGHLRSFCAYTDVNPVDTTLIYGRFTPFAN
jgi:hypothetical protein